MGLVTKTNPVGIDAVIQQLQTSLYNYLVDKWGLTTDTFNCFGRCYKNQTADGYTAEAFVLAKDYREVYLDDKVSATSFFGIADKESIQNGVNSTQAFLVLFVDLTKIKPTISHRADEEAHVDVQNALQHSPFAEMTGVITGIDNVLKEYPGTRKNKGLKFRDMHPIHCFRIDMNISYTPSDC